MFTPAIHRGAHRSDRLAKTYKQRLADHVIADVELDDFRQARDLLRGRVIEAVAGMHLKPGRTREPAALDDTEPFRLGFFGVSVDHGVAPGAGMNFDHRR